MNTPLRNSKGANKPYRSPFNNTGSSDPKPYSKLRQEKLIPQQSSVKKRRKSIGENKVCPGKSETQEINVHFDFSKFTQGDLELKRQKVQEMEETVNNLRTKLLYHKHTKAENLGRDINKWREVCQTALERLLKETRDKYDSSCNMNQLLSSLGIPETLVKYSTETEDFYQ